jgi:hypothetical protein
MVRRMRIWNGLRVVGPPGSYRLTVSAANEAGKTTAAQHPTFTLLV